MNYDAEANLISWEIAEGKIDHVRELGNFIIHVSKSEKPLLIEILDASKYKNQFAKLKKEDILAEALSTGN